ncbi:MAG TPA: hypothetical protein VNF04_06690 [Stellaceae bacterium]|nr:hypothetical protein [Stellaceae bacterium]
MMLGEAADQAQSLGEVVGMLDTLHLFEHQRLLASIPVPESAFEQLDDGSWLARGLWAPAEANGKATRAVFTNAAGDPVLTATCGLRGDGPADVLLTGWLAAGMEVTIACRLDEAPSEDGPGAP